MKKLIKYLGLSIVLITTITIILFINLSPQFGGEISEEQKIVFEQLDHYENGKFVNFEPFSIKSDCHSVTEMIKEIVNPPNNIRPKKNIEVVKFDINSIGKDLNGKARVVWLGHSSFLLEIESKTILIDPVFGEYAAPHKLLGRKRYNDEMPFDIEKLNKIDAVIISHDHYDHLDFPTIEKIKAKVENVIVPLGVGNHFIEWGIHPDKVQQLDWWNETMLGSLKIVLTPSRHSSGRGINDQAATLWGSWCFIGTNQKIYFSGDGGYGSHFKQIGEKYGPFDFGMIECGQYNEKWAGMHMFPEESVQAGIDLKINTFMPIHWGTFSLASHGWTDPIERFLKKAGELKVSVSTPRIGESILIKSNNYSKANWWKQFD